MANHIKVVFEPGKPVEAKVYLSIIHEAEGLAGSSNFLRDGEGEDADRQDEEGEGLDFEDDGSEDAYIDEEGEGADSEDEDSENAHLDSDAPGDRAEL